MEGHRARRDALHPRAATDERHRHGAGAEQDLSGFDRSQHWTVSHRQSWGTPRIMNSMGSQHWSVDHRQQWPHHVLRCDGPADRTIRHERQHDDHLRQLRSSERDYPRQQVMLWRRLPLTGHGLVHSSRTLELQHPGDVISLPAADHGGSCAVGPCPASIVGPDDRRLGSTLPLGLRRMRAGGVWGLLPLFHGRRRAAVLSDQAVL